MMSNRGYAVALAGLLLLLRIVVSYVTSKYVARRWLGIALLSGGSLYFVGMFFRLLASVTFAAADS